MTPETDTAARVMISAMAGERVLIVDDDADIRESTGEYLAGHGYRTAFAADGQQMRDAIGSLAPDVVLLDLNLPGEDGLSLARWLRRHHDVAIIMVTGSADVVDRVIGLEVGADDYIAKPFDLRELRARLRSVLRRTRARAAAAASPERPATKRVRVGRCELDLATHQLFGADGREISITATDFDLLKVFAENANRVLSRDQLLTMTSNREWEPFDRAIDIRIARLRRKIEPDPENPGVIRTVRGAGYMFVSG
jgi:DNA-binding response OmpR family regulator